MRIATSCLQGIWSNSFLQVSKTCDLGHLLWYMHALLTNVFFSENFHPKASLCNCRPVAWNKCFFRTHRHCDWCAYWISNGFGLWPLQVIFTRSTQRTWRNMCHLYSVNTNNLTYHVASVLPPAIFHDVTCNIFTRSTQRTWHNMCHLYSVSTNNLTYHVASVLPPAIFHDVTCKHLYSVNTKNLT